MCRLLLDEGASLEERDAEGRTALMTGNNTRHPCVLLIHPIDTACLCIRIIRPVDTVQPINKSYQHILSIHTLPLLTLSLSHT